jgi:hypothetical protein
MQISFWELVYGINDECNVYFYYSRACGSYHDLLTDGYF